MQGKAPAEHLIDSSAQGAQIKAFGDWRPIAPNAVRADCSHEGVQRNICVARGGNALEDRFLVVDEEVHVLRNSKCAVFAPDDERARVSKQRKKRLVHDHGAIPADETALLCAHAALSRASRPREAASLVSSDTRKKRSKIEGDRSMS